MVALLLQLLRLNKMDKQPQTVFEKVINRNMVLCDKLRAHESVLRVLDQLPKVDHQAPWEGSLGLEPLEEDVADLLLDGGIALIEQD